MDIDRKSLVQSLGGEAAVAKMSHEARADALEEFQIAKLDAEVAAQRATRTFPTVAEHEALIDTRGYRRGIGKLFRQARLKGGQFSDSAAPPTVTRLPKMPEKPDLFDFFEYRFAPATHLLQSAALAKRKGCSDQVILACLLHDIGGTLMKADHGYWGAQLIEPYVSEKIAFAIRYHQALRFFPDSDAGYEYPVRYYEAFGIDYVPPPHIQAAYEYARNHPWYTEARLVTTNDLYASNPDIKVHINEFRDIIGRHFRMPEDGLGYDNSPVAHMWRTMINPDAPL
jgi:hypothetical protein